jgi:hypothetical protein
MTEREHPEDDEGAMTGATGALTPPDADEAFVPAERREIEDPFEGRRGTAALKRESEELSPDRGAPEVERHGGPTNLAERNAGYGSEHGLSPGDPAYRMEEHLPPPDSGPPREPDEDGDERREGEEHF